MKSIVISVAVVLSISLPVSPNWAAGKLAEEDVFGSWIFPENGSVIQLYRCKEYVCVKVLKVADPRRRDVNNPDPALRNRLLAGIVIADSFARVGPANGRERQDNTLKWRGRLYNTLDGVTYDGTLNLLDRNTITMVGCVLEGLFCEAKTFYRVKGSQPDGAPAQIDHNASSSSHSVTPPPLPVRKPAQIRLGSLRDMFDRFLESQAARTSRTFTEKERDTLFNGFLAWLERQPAEDRNKITEQLTQ